MIVAFAILCLLASSNLSSVDAAVIEHMLASKLRMSNIYHVRVRIESQDHLTSNTTRYGYTVELWRHGDKFRIDTTEADGGRPAPAGLVRAGGLGARDITCQNCERPGYFVVTTVQPGKPKITNMVGFHKTPALSPTFTNFNIDWRFLGLSNNSIYMYNKLSIIQDYRGFLSNPNIQFDRYVYADKPCLRAALNTVKRQNHTNYSLTEEGNPLQKSTTCTISEGNFDIKTDIGWCKTPGDHLYPSQITHSEYSNGKLQSTEIITVLHADFYSPTEPAIFTLAGMGLNDGQLIAFPELPHGDHPHWNSGKVDLSLSSNALKAAYLASAPAITPAGPLAPYPSADNALLIVSVATGVFAVVMLLVAVVSRGRQGKA